MSQANNDEAQPESRFEDPFQGLSNMPAASQLQTSHQTHSLGGDNHHDASNSSDAGGQVDLSAVMPIPHVAGTTTSQDPDGDDASWESQLFDETAQPRPNHTSSRGGNSNDDDDMDLLSIHGTTVDGEDAGNNDTTPIPTKLTVQSGVPTNLAFQSGPPMVIEYSESESDHDQALLLDLTAMPAPQNVRRSESFDDDLVSLASGMMQEEEEPHLDDEHDQVDETQEVGPAADVGQSKNDIENQEQQTDTAPPQPIETSPPSNIAEKPAEVTSQGNSGGGGGDLPESDAVPPVQEQPAPSIMRQSSDVDIPAPNDVSGPSFNSDINKAVKKIQEAPPPNNDDAPFLQDTAMEDKMEEERPIGTWEKSPGGTWLKPEVDMEDRLQKMAENPDFPEYPPQDNSDGGSLDGQGDGGSPLFDLVDLDGSNSNNDAAFDDGSDDPHLENENEPSETTARAMGENVTRYATDDESDPPTPALSPVKEGAIPYIQERSLEEETPLSGDYPQSVIVPSPERHDRAPPNMQDASRSPPPPPPHGRPPPRREGSSRSSRSGPRGQMPQTRQTSSRSFRSVSEGQQRQQQTIPDMDNRGEGPPGGPHRAPPPRSRSAPYGPQGQQRRPPYPHEGRRPMPPPRNASSSSAPPYRSYPPRDPRMPPPPRAYHPEAAPSRGIAVAPVPKGEKDPETASGEYITVSEEHIERTRRTVTWLVVSFACALVLLAALVGGLLGALVFADR